MRSIVSVAALSTLLCLVAPAGFAGAPPTSRNAPGTIVIVFKDGHKQSFNLSDIERVEFPNVTEVANSAGSANSPSRGRYLGKWECGDGEGNNFYITLLENGEAKRSIGDVHGHWVYMNGEALVTWKDGAQDAIRKVGSKFQKSAYSAGKSFTDIPDNVTDAHNTTPHPI
ncbi:MAG: hypothetical protein ABSD67_20880 [Terracidiphilus sp.]|jgi:hypothetical protein